LVVAAFNCQVTTVAQVEQVANAPAQQSIRSAFVMKRLVVSVVI
jgi:hypothetical protein